LPGSIPEKGTDSILMTSRVMAKGIGLGQTRAPDLDGHLGAGLAAQLAHGVVDGDAACALAVDLDDAVTGLDAHALGGSAVQRRDHRQHVLPHADGDAQSTELAFGVDLEVVDFLLGEVRRCGDPEWWTILGWRHRPGCRVESPRRRRR
jgi:hypothetical protein